MANSLIVNDMFFKSIVEACQYFNKTEYYVRYRLRRGWTPNQVFGFEPHINDRSVEIEGNVYRSAREACFKHNVPYTSALRTRLQKGTSMQKIIMRKISPKYLVNNMTFNSIKECCDYYNVSLDTLYHRCSNLSEHLEEVLNKYIKDRITHEGKTYRNLTEACRETGVSYNKAYYYKRLGYSNQIAFNGALSGICPRNIDLLSKL